MDMDVADGIEQINFAYQKSYDDKLWEVWLVQVQGMDRNNFESFNDYKQRVNRPVTNQPTLTVEQQITEAERIKSIDQMR